MRGETERLTVDTGVLTLEQVNLMLAHLPVDVSFADQDDKIAYYSQTRERIFPGRLVLLVERCRTVIRPRACLWYKKSQMSLGHVRKTPPKSGST